MNDDLSPCIGICHLNSEDICIGCYRTLKELEIWSVLDDKTKLSILEKCSVRKGHHETF